MKKYFRELFSDSRRVRFFAIVVASTLILDRVTKALAQLYLSEVKEFRFEILLLRLQHTENSGAFLSLGAQLSSEFRYFLFVVIVFAVILVCMVSAMRTPKEARFQILGLCLLVGGGLGNLVDRIGHGSVTDFLWLQAGPFHTGVFNVADMAIMAGVGLMLVQALVSEKPAQSPKTPS